MGWMNALKAAVRGLAGFIPGVNVVAAAVETAAEVAEAIGGSAGEKISRGARELADGLEEAAGQALSPEQRVRLAEIQTRHEERMAGLELADTQGGRALARDEIASSDAFVRRTRPLLLRVFGFASIGLVLVIVALAFAAVFAAEITPVEAGFLGEAVSWAVGAVLGAFVLMYRAYVDKRTAEKLAEVGMKPEGLVDKLVRLKTGEGC